MVGTNGGMTLKYAIGEYYKYPFGRWKYKLVRVDGHIFHFECGHWCTDTVFQDLVRFSTGVQVGADFQTELFI